jgi:trimethylamine:corrinoid methyltransferase-like protein
MRPRFQLLDDDLAERIITEAKTVLAEVGVEINDEQTRDLLADHGANVGGADGRVRYGESMVEAALDSAPLEFSLYDVLGKETHHFDGKKPTSRPVRRRSTSSTVPRARSGPPSPQTLSTSPDW